MLPYPVIHWFIPSTLWILMGSTNTGLAQDTSNIMYEAGHMPCRT